MGISGIQFMVEICVGLGVVTSILLLLAMIFMALINGRLKQQSSSISFILHCAKDAKRRQDARDEQMISSMKSNKERPARKPGN